MSIGDKFSLGLSTTFIGMAIVFMVLVALWAIIVIEHKIITAITDKSKTPENKIAVQNTEIETAAAMTIKSGKSTGKFVIEGVDDDETVAIILAAVSEYTNIPMNKLKVTSIKAV